jgi:hypothetical protein
VQFLPHRPEIQIGLRRIGLQRDGLGVRVRSLLVVAHRVMRHPQVEPVLETLRNQFGQTAAVACRRRVVPVLIRQRRQRFQGHRRLRLQLGQHLRIAPHRLAVVLFEGDNHQVGERLLAPRIANQDLAVVLRRFGDLAGLLQSRALPEQRLLVIGEESEILVERFHRLGRAPAVDQAEAQPQRGVRAGGVGFGRLPERLRGGRPTFQIAPAHPQVKMRDAMERLQFHQSLVDRGGRFIIAHLVVNLAQRRVQRGIAHARFNRAPQQAGGALELAFQVQRYSLRERAIRLPLTPEAVDRGHAGG